MVHKMGIYMLIKNIKKINYIIGFTISFLVLYQPIQHDIENFLNEKKRVEYEKYVNSFLTRDTVSILLPVLKLSINMPNTILNSSFISL